MSKLSTIKTTLAAAAGMMALATWAPSAEAGTITFEFNYAAAIGSGTASLTSLVYAEATPSYDGIASNGDYLEAYLITGFASGTRANTNTGGTTTTQAVTGLATGVPSISVDGVQVWTDGNYTFDNLFYIDTTVGSTDFGRVYLDQYGIAFLTADHEYNVDVDDTEYLFAGTAYQQPNPLYGYIVEAVDTTNENVVVAISARQVPAPTALLLLGASLVGLSAIRRRKTS